jgi:hypothetical protein
MKHKVDELTGALLDAAVAKALGVVILDLGLVVDGEPVVCLPEAGEHNYVWRPSREWHQGGPLIERERINLVYCEPGTTAGDAWEAYLGDLSPRRLDNDPASGDGPTPLIAAMRAFVCKKLGDEVDLP